MGAKNNLRYSFQNTVLQVSDQFGFQVPDYFAEFYTSKLGHGRFEQVFHERVIHSVHVFSDNLSYRSLYTDCIALKAIFNAQKKPLSFGLTAHPEFEKKKNVVGYKTFKDQDIGAIKFGKSEVNQVFCPNRTLLIRVTIRREQSSDLFKLNRFMGT